MHTLTLLPNSTMVAAKYGHKCTCIHFWKLWRIISRLLMDQELNSAVNNMEEIELGATATTNSDGIEETHYVVYTDEETLPIWTSRHPTHMDTLATMQFLAIVKSPNIQNKLKDKQRRKKLVFAEVAQEMIKKGFNFGEDIPADKCLNKYQNLERSFKAMLLQAGKTGEKSKTLPPHYEHLHELFGDKHSIASLTAVESLNAEVTTTLKDSSTFPSSQPLPDIPPTTHAVTNAGAPPQSSHTIATVPSGAGRAVSLTINLPEPSLEDKHSMVEALFKKLDELERHELQRDLEMMRQRDEDKQLSEERFRSNEERFRSLEERLERHHQERQASLGKLVDAIKSSSKSKKRNHESSGSD